MRVIHKFAIQPGSLTFVYTNGSVFIPRSVQVQDNVLTLWAEISDDFVDNAQRKVFALATGQPIPDGAAYVGSAQHFDLVWHVYVAG